MRKAFVLLVCFFLLGGVAEAARPPLSLHRADRAAKLEAGDTVRAWADAYAEDPEAARNVYIVRFDLDSCERDSASHASCDVTYFLNDGDQCDSTITVHTTRRNRVVSGDAEPSCDGD